MEEVLLHWKSLHESDAPSKEYELLKDRFPFTHLGDKVGVEGGMDNRTHSTRKPNP